MTREFRQILAEIELLSHGAVQAWDKTAQPADKDTRPKGETNPPHEQFYIDYICARTDEQRLDVVDDARRFLREWRGLKKPKPTVTRDKDEIDKEMRSFTGWLPLQVERRTGGIVTQKAIRDWRKEQDPPLDEITGKAYVPDEPKRDKVLRLAREGVAPADIARIMGMPRQGVSQMLKRAA
jgi:hypothetical protein